MADNFLIVPGSRVGPVRANSTEADPVKLLGRDAVTVHDTVYISEDQVEVGTTLYNGQPDAYCLGRC